MKQFGGNLQPFSTPNEKTTSLELDLTGLDRQHIQHGLIRALARLYVTTEPDVHIQSAKGVKLTEPPLEPVDFRQPYESDLSATFASLREGIYAAELHSKGLRYMPSYTRKLELHKTQKTNSWILDNAIHTQIGTQTHGDVLDYLYQRLPDTTGLSTDFVDRPPQTATEASATILNWLEKNGATMTETQSFKGTSLLVGQHALYTTGAALSITRHKDSTVYSGSISTESEITKALKYKSEHFDTLDRTRYEVDAGTVGQMYHFTVNQPHQLDTPATISATLQTQAPDITSGALDRLTSAQRHVVDIEQIVENMTTIVENDVALRFLDN